MTLRIARIFTIAAWAFLAVRPGKPDAHAEIAKKDMDRLYSVHVTLTEKLDFRECSEDSGGAGVSPGGYGLGTERTLLRFEDSRGSLVLVARQRVETQTLLKGGGILSSGVAWLGAGPGRLSGVLASLSRMLPSSSILRSSIPISISSALDSSSFMFGFGTEDFAVLTARRTVGENPFAGATFAASSGGDIARCAVAASAIAVDSRFPLLGWKPGEPSDPAAVAYRLAGGLSIAFEGWKVELRSAFSMGRVISPGAGFGASLEYSRESLSVHGALALQSAELRDLEARRARSVAALRAGLAYRARGGTRLSFRTEMEILSENSSAPSASTEEEDDDGFGDEVDGSVDSATQTAEDSSLWLEVLSGAAHGLAFSGAFSLRFPLGSDNPKLRRSDGIESDSFLSLDIAASGAGAPVFNNLKTAFGFTSGARKGGDMSSEWHASVSARGSSSTNFHEDLSVLISGSGGVTIKAPVYLARGGKGSWGLASSFDLSSNFDGRFLALLAGKASLILDSSLSVENASGESAALGFQFTKTISAGDGRSEAGAGIAPSISIFVRGTVETRR